MDEWKELENEEAISRQLQSTRTFSLEVQNWERRSTTVPSQQELWQEIQILKAEIKELKEMKPLDRITDEQAEIQVRHYFESLLETDKTTINILDLVVDLGLPPDQIERIMKILEPEGVKPIE